MNKSYYNTTPEEEKPLKTLYMRTTEFATVSGMHERTVARLCKAGKIQGVKKFGGRYLIPRSLIEVESSQNSEA